MKKIHMTNEETARAIACGRMCATCENRSEDGACSKTGDEVPGWGVCLDWKHTLANYPYTARTARAAVGMHNNTVCSTCRFWRGVCTETGYTEPLIGECCQGYKHAIPESGVDLTYGLSGESYSLLRECFQEGENVRISGDTWHLKVSTKDFSQTRREILRAVEELRHRAEDSECPF